MLSDPADVTKYLTLLDGMISRFFFQRIFGSGMPVAGQCSVIGSRMITVYSSGLSSIKGRTVQQTNNNKKKIFVT